jgi:hypothetical protein
VRSGKCTSPGKSIATRARSGRQGSEPGIAESQGERKKENTSCPPPCPTPPPVVVGIAGYQHINPLPTTVLQDARDIHSLLVDPQHCGYPPGHVHLLTDEQATAP